MEAATRAASNTTIRRRDADLVSMAGGALDNPDP
jgi:hypothetical protein